MSDLHLHAASLFSKWGFGDGEVIDEWYWDTFNEPIPNGISHHDVLIELVRKVLVPAIEAAGHCIDVYEIDTSHNPIRARCYDDVDVPDELIYGDIDKPAWTDDISVTITPVQMRELTRLDYVTDADGRSTPIPPVGQLCTCYVEDQGDKQTWVTVPDCPFHGGRISA